MPQLPHGSLLAGFVAGSEVSTLQEPHEQVEEHVCVPVPLHACVAPGAHVPPPVQVPQAVVSHVPVAFSQSTLLVCVPVLQLPQACVAVGFVAGLQSITLHVPQAQEEEQVCVPVVLQVCVAPGAQVPPPVQVPHVPVVQVPVEVLQVTVLV